MKVYFWIDADNETIELDDDATENDIDDEFQSWVDGSLACGWTIEEEDEQSSFIRRIFRTYYVRKKS